MKEKAVVFPQTLAPHALATAALALLCLLGLTRQASAQSLVFTNGWVGPTTTGSTRALAYSTVSNEVFVANTGGSIAVFDGTAGTSVGSVSFSGTTGVFGGAQTLNQIGVADDGVLYGADLVNPVSSTSIYRIYRWSTWNSTATLAYGGDPTSGGTPVADGQRMGDSFAITGAGTNTMIVAGISTKSAFVLFSTVDGINFTSTVLTVPSGPVVGTANGGGFGLAFYTNHTFIAKSLSSSTLYLIQFPANLSGLTAATGAVLATSTLATPTSASATALFSFSSDKRLLGVAFLGSSGQKYYGNLYAFDFTNGPTLLASTNATAASNGNLTGGVALGGNGKTNWFYVVNSANTMEAYSILAIPPQPPSITTQPVGGTVYPPFTLSVAALGAGLGYQWAATNAAATGSFTNIPGATASSYTVTGVATNFYQVVITNAGGSATSAPVLVKTLNAITNSAVTVAWRVAPGASGFSWLSSSDGYERGLAYDTNSQRLVVAATSGEYVISANTGQYIEQLNITGVTFASLLPGIGSCQVGIADDGAVYVGDVVQSGSAFALWRWGSPSNSVTSTNAFNSDPGNGGANSERWGDTMAVRGRGPGTQILLGSRANGAGGGTNVALLLPNDGVGLTYSSLVIAVSNVPSGFSANGVCFGAGNTFWAKNQSGDLFEIAFDTNLMTGAVVFDYATGTQVPSSTTGVGVDPVNNILALIKDTDNPNDLQLSQLTGTSDSPVLFDQVFFALGNTDPNGNAAITIKYPRVYGLSVNDGLVAANYGVPAATAPAITTPPANVSVYTNVGSVTLSVSATGSLPLYYQWYYNSNKITGATSSQFVITNTALPVGGYYDVVVHNIAGSVTSTPPALVTLVTPVTSPLVTPLWEIGPGTNGAYLTANGSETRGLAFDPATGSLLIADHLLIHVYDATNGVYEYDMNTAGLPTGLNGWTVDQVGVADDGIIYSCNLTAEGLGFAITAYPTETGTPYLVFGQSDQLNALSPGDRWGDTMAVRGQGVNTEILFGSDYTGSEPATNVVLFTTGDGQTFTPQLIPIPGVPAGFSEGGVAFGPGNTFYTKGGYNYNLRWIAFDTNADTGTVLQVFNVGTQVPYNMTGLAVDVTNNILAGVSFDDNPDSLHLYLLSGNSNAPALFDQDFFPAANPNSNGNAASALNNGWGFSLDANNGVVAFNYSVPSAPAVKLPSVAYAPGHVTVTWGNTFDNHAYKVYSTTNLAGTWTLLGTVTATNATASFADTSAPGPARFYQVVSQ